jgi:hypothetical protein
MESGDATYPGRCPQTAGTVAKLLMASIVAAMQSLNERRFQLDVMLGEEGRAVVLSRKKRMVTLRVRRHI